MRKRLVWMALAAALIVTGCAKTPSAVTAGEVDAPADAQQGGLSAVQVETQARALTKAEVWDAYDRAVTAYGWFDLSPLPCGQEQVTVDGRLYRRVDYPGIEDLGDLRAYLRVVFSEELTEDLLDGGDHPLYVDVDGALYAAADAGREKDGSKGTVEVQVEQQSDTAYSVEVAVELLDSTRTSVIGVASYSFPYELVDGEWVFTDFSLVY